MIYDIKPSPKRSPDAKRSQVLDVVEVKEQPPAPAFDIMVIRPVPFASVIEDWIAEILESSSADNS